MYVHQPPRNRYVDVVSDTPSFRRLLYGGPNAIENAVSYAMHYNRSHDAVIRVYDERGDAIKTQKYEGYFKEW